MALLWRDQSANRSSVAPFFQLAEEKEREKKKATERKNQISHWCDMFRQRRKELGKGERSILAILQRIWEEDRGKRGEEKEEEEMPREKLYLCAAIHTDRWPCAHIDMMLGSLSLSVTKEHIGASSKEHALGIKEHWRKPASQPALVVVVVVVLEEPLLLQCISRRGQHISGHLQEAKEMPQQQKRSDC